MIRATGCGVVVGREIPGQQERSREGTFDVGVGGYDEDLVGPGDEPLENVRDIAKLGFSLSRRSSGLAGF